MEGFLVRLACCLPVWMAGAGICLLGRPAYVYRTALPAVATRCGVLGKEPYAQALRVVLEIHVLLVLRLSGLLRLVELNGIVDMTQDTRNTILILHVEP